MNKFENNAPSSSPLYDTLQQGLQSVQLVIPLSSSVPYNRYRTVKQMPYVNKWTVVIISTIIIHPGIGTVGTSESTKVRYRPACLRGAAVHTQNLLQCTVVLY